MRTHICKSWSFDAAHQLPNHDGKCRNLHGHTYKLEVECEWSDGGIQPENGHPEEGMVIDFYKITQVWKNHLEPLLDHKFLNDTLGFLTTSENISKWALGVFRNHRIPAVAVSVSETASSKATTYLTDLEKDKRIYKEDIKNEHFRF